MRPDHVHEQSHQPCTTSDDRAFHLQAAGHPRIARPLPRRVDGFCLPTGVRHPFCLDFVASYRSLVCPVLHASPCTSFPCFHVQKYISGCHATTVYLGFIIRPSARIPLPCPSCRPPIHSSRAVVPSELARCTPAPASPGPLLGYPDNNLAILYQHQCRYTDAEPLYRRALAIFERSLGSDHPETVVCRDNLASLLRRQGRQMESDGLDPHASAI
jgi:tetratricopeptide repeat protein